MAEYTHTLTKKDNAKVFLEITVPANVVASGYAQVLADVGKKAQIKGFRKGKVPNEVLEQKFGDAIRGEATEHIIQDALKVVLEEVEAKPLPYSTPQLEFDEKADSNTDSAEHTHISDDGFFVDTKKDYVFTISYDTNPEIEPSSVSDLKLEPISVKIDDKDIEAELKGIQARNALTVQKKEPIENDDIVTYNYVEIDEQGAELTESAREGYTSTIGQDKNLYGFDSDIIGMKTGEEKIIDKSYPEDYEFEELAGKTRRLKITITDVKTKDLPPIDDDLAQDVNEKYKTLGDLKAQLKIQLEERADYMIKDINRNKILAHLVKNSKVEVPDAAVAMQQESMWKQFAQQFGGEQALDAQLGNSGNSKAQLLETWKSDAYIKMKEQLLISKLLEDTQEITDEEVEKTLKEDSDRAGQNYEEILAYYKEHNLFPQIKYDLQQKNLFEKLSKDTIISKGKDKPKSFTELLEYKQELEKKATDDDTARNKK